LDSNGWCAGESSASLMSPPTLWLVLCASGFAQVASLLSSEIPVAKTPNNNGSCGLDAFAPPILAECTEPLAPGVADIRGTWVGDMGAEVIQRIEQCGDRVVIAGPGGDGSKFVIRDALHADGTYENGVNDYVQSKLPECVDLVVAAVFEKNCYQFMNKALGGGVSVQRCAMPNGTMLFDYGDMGRFIFTNSNPMTVTCQQLKDVYKAHGCCGMPEKQIAVDTDWCGAVQSTVTCSDIKHHYKANKCCGSPEKIVNKPGWCQYTPSQFL